MLLDAVFRGFPPSDNAIKVARNNRIIYSTAARKFSADLRRTLTTDYVEALSAILKQDDPWAIYAVTIELHYAILTSGFAAGKALSPFKVSDVSNRQKLILDALSESFGADKDDRRAIDDKRFMRVTLTQVHTLDDPHFRLRMSRIPLSDIGVSSPRQQKLAI